MLEAEAEEDLVAVVLVVLAAEETEILVALQIYLLKMVELI